MMISKEKSRRNQLQRLFVHHESCNNSPGIELKALLWEARALLPIPLTVFLGPAYPCTLKDGRSKFLENVTEFLSGYTVSHPGRQ
jgi:hypothetical protein